MNEGLEKLKTIRHIHDMECGEDASINKDFDIIENELKEKQKFDEFLKRYNLNSIEELDDFFNQCLNKEIEKCSKCKEFKVLEIIKRINFDIAYQEQFDEWTLFIIYETEDGPQLVPIAFGSGKDQYELLKEMLL